MCLLCRRADVSTSASALPPVDRVGQFERAHSQTRIIMQSVKLQVSLRMRAGLQRQADELGASFEAPLRESVRAVKAVQAVMADRNTALAAVQQARAEVEAKRAKLTKLRGMAGMRVCLHSLRLKSSRRCAAYAAACSQLTTGRSLTAPSTCWHVLYASYLQSDRAFKSTEPNVTCTG